MYGSRILQCGRRRVELGRETHHEGRREWLLYPWVLRNHGHGGGDCFANHSDEVPHVGFAAQLELRVVERLADHPLEHGRANVSSITAP